MPAVQKICCVCNTDVSGKKRVKDPQGQYYCEDCYSAKINEKKSTPVSKQIPVAAAAPAPAAAPPANLDNFDDLGFADEVRNADDQGSVDTAMFGCADCKKLVPEKNIRNDDGEFVCSACFVKRKQANVKGPKTLTLAQQKDRASGLHEKKGGNIWIQLACWVGGALAMLALMFAVSWYLPDMARKVFAGVAIVGIILFYVGLRWAIYIAASDNLALRLICRFVPFLGIAVVIRHSLIDWGEMQVPVFTALSGLVLAIVGGIFWFTISVAQEVNRMDQRMHNQIRHAQPANPDEQAPAENAPGGAAPAPEGAAPAPEAAPPAEGATPAADTPAPAPAPEAAPAPQ